MLVRDDTPDLSALLASMFGVSSEGEQILYMLLSSLCLWLKITSFMILSPLFDSFSASYLASFSFPAFSPSACVHHSCTGFEENTFLSIKTQYRFFFLSSKVAYED